MTKRLLTLSVLFVAVLMLGTSGTLMATLKFHYRVWYSCIVSPPGWGFVEGEWDLDCDGNWTGWGWEPGSNCSTTDVTSSGCPEPPPTWESTPLAPSCRPAALRSLSAPVFWSEASVPAAVR